MVAMPSENELSRLFPKSLLLSLIFITRCRVPNTCFWMHRLCESWRRSSEPLESVKGEMTRYENHCHCVLMGEVHVDICAGNLLLQVYSRIIISSDASLNGEHQRLMPQLMLTYVTLLMIVSLFCANHLHFLCFAF